jgi:hypothetical protein
VLIGSSNLTISTRLLLNFTCSPNTDYRVSLAKSVSNCKIHFSNATERPNWEWPQQRLTPRRAKVTKCMAENAALINTSAIQRMTTGNHENVWQLYRHCNLMVIKRCKCSGVIKQNTGRKYVFIRTCKAMLERIQQNIKAKCKIPILYCTANQLIEVKVSFAFGYRMCSAGKYLVPKMH